MSAYNRLDEYMLDLSKRIKHDETTKRVVFLIGISAFTDSPINGFQRGPSSIGKTYTVVETLKMFPQENIVYIGRMSPTALGHEYGTLIDERDGSKFSEHDAPNKNDFKPDGKKIDHKAFNDAKRKWAEKLKNSYYAVDLSNKILVFLEAPEIETFNMLRPILSHDVAEISHKITGKTQAGGHRTQHIKIRGFPATIFCTTELDYIEELATRSLTHTPDMNTEKYAAAVQHQGEKSAFPWVYDEEDPDTEALKDRLARIIKKFGENRRVVIPYGPELSRAYKATMPRDMRDFTKLQDLIKASCILHMDQRPVINAGGKPAIVATFMDLYNSARVFGSIEEATKSGLSGHVVRIFYDIIYKDWISNATKPTRTITDYRNLYRDMTGLNIGRTTFYEYIKALEETGWIELEQSKDDRRRKTVSVAKGSGGENLFTSLYNFKETFTPEKLKEYLSKLAGVLRSGDLYISDSIEEPEKHLLYTVDPDEPPFVWGDEYEDMFNECFNVMFDGLDMETLVASATTQIMFEGEDMGLINPPPTPKKPTDDTRPVFRDMEKLVNHLGDLVLEANGEMVQTSLLEEVLKTEEGWTLKKTRATIEMCRQNNDLCIMGALVGLNK